MPVSHIRPIAVCFVRDGDRLLVEHGYDSVGRRNFYRVVGGGIEFGERAADAVCREWMEELGADLIDVRLLGVTENLFTNEGKPGHEIVFVFTGRLRDAGRFVGATLEIEESDGQRHAAEWIPVAQLAGGAIPLYPDGALALYQTADA